MKNKIIFIVFIICFLWLYVLFSSNSEDKKNIEYNQELSVSQELLESQNLEKTKKNVDFISNFYKENFPDSQFSFNDISQDFDIDSFKSLDENYFIDKNSAYFRWFKIEKSDPKTFVLLGDNYSKDKNNVYCLPPFSLSVTNIENADSESFKLIKEDYLTYWKDKKNIYFDCLKVEWADLETFQYYWWYAKDKNGLYILDFMEWARPVEVLKSDYSDKYKTIDKGTFSSIWRGYFKDKNHIYYIPEYNVWSDDWWIIDSADLDSFRLEIGKWYHARDKNNYYLYWKNIKN